MAALSDEAKIRELAEAIRSKCAQTQQIRQQPPGAVVTTASSAINLQPQQEVKRRLREVVSRLQEDVRDNSLSGIQQRLEFTAKKFGLTFNVQRAPGHPPTCYMSCESFFLEVCLEESGTPVNTKLVLVQEPQNSEILTNLLRQRDYPAFETHIKSLVNIFSQYNGQGKSKVLLQVIKATEHVLFNIYTNSQPYPPLEMIQLQHFGLLTPRQAGNPMSLMFYITPQESINCPTLDNYKTGSPLPDSLGVSAKVLVERSIQPYQLPIDPNLFDVSQSSFNPLSDQNSRTVPLTLVLSLSKDIPICTSIMLKLQQTVYGADQTLNPSLTAPHVNQLILGANKENGVNPNKHVIYLPGQVHTYCGIDSSADMEPDHRGVLLPNRKVPFTHPSHVIGIVHFLRQQLVYNTLFRSCLQRKKFNHSFSPEPAFDDFEFKISTKPPELIAVSTELLNKNGGTTFVKFDFMVPNDRTQHPTRPILHITINNGVVLDQSQILNKVLARCLSIPVTLHAILSHLSVLPPPLASVISEHKESIRIFNNQLMSGDEPSSSTNHIEVGLSYDGRIGGSSNLTGMKRKRI